MARPSNLDRIGNRWVAYDAGGYAFRVAKSKAWSCWVAKPSHSGASTDTRFISAKSLYECAAKVGASHTPSAPKPRELRFALWSTNAKHGTVPALKSVTGIGTYDPVTRDSYQPDKDAVRAALPFKWRKAFDRSPNFWHARHGEAQQFTGAKGVLPHLSLHNARGVCITDVYACPVVGY